MSSKKKDSIGFPPYLVYQNLTAQIDEFSSLTECSYGLAQQLLFKHPPETVKLAEWPKPKSNELSFGMGSEQVKSVKVACEWVTFSIYSEREKIPIETVQQAAQEGRLGPLREGVDGDRHVLWAARIPQNGRVEMASVWEKKFTVTLELTARAEVPADPSALDTFDERQREYLRLAHALGEPAKVAENASEVINRSVFLLEWISFEVFLRLTLQELIKKHPHVLGSGKRGKDTLTLQELVQLSDGLSDIESLRSGLVTREIERQELGGESVHGLLNLLKSQFKFKEDPYGAWYVLKGERKTTSYNELLELKETRNVLMHDAGRVSSSFQAAYPNVPVRDGIVVINDDFYLRALLVLRSVAFLVARTADRDEYVA